MAQRFSEAEVSKLGLGPRVETCNVSSLYTRDSFVSSEFLNYVNS